MLEKWGLIIAWDIPNDCYIASVPELLACTGTGSTRREALDALEQEVEVWLETQRQIDQPVHEYVTPQQALTPEAVLKGIEQTNHVAKKLPKGRKKRISKDRLTLEVDADLPIVQVIGEVDLRNAGFLRAELEGLIQSGVGTILIDLTYTEYIDSAGLALLLTILKRLRSQEASLLVVRSSTPFVDGLFRISHLDSILRMFNTVDEAVIVLEELRFTTLPLF